MLGKAIRLSMVLAATVASIAPAMADIVVQETSNQMPVWNPAIFEGFDYSLGTLNNVTLQISGTERRFFGTVYPEGATQPITVDWLISGNSIFRFYNTDNAYQEFLLPIFGSGQVTVTEGASWYMTTFGEATFTINPSLILDSNSNPWHEGKVGFRGPGFYDYSDVTFISSEPITINAKGGGCGGLISGEEYCNLYRYRLTYEYSPLIPGIPEPGTWAMALFGFGMIGSILRRRSFGKLSATQP